MKNSISISELSKTIPPEPPQSYKRYFNTRDKVGVLVVVLVYILFFKIYIFTVYRALWDGMSQSNVADIVNFIFFTLLFLLALVSHFQCMTITPGFLPKNYETLDERKLSQRFNKLIQERESMYQNAEVRKLLRKGVEEDKAKAMISEKYNDELN